MRREEIPVRLLYDRFREILALNESVHHLIAGLEDQIAGRRPFVLEATVQKVRQGLLDGLIMVKNLNQIAGGRYMRLYDSLAELGRDFETFCTNQARMERGPLVIPLSELTAAQAGQAGTKMANLGETRNVVGLPVPEGFAVSTAAFHLFMSENGLWERAHQLNRLAGSESRTALSQAAWEVREAILRAPVPARVQAGMLSAYDRLAGTGPLLLAVRSSAVGEDLASSHAGQYHTELNVGREDLLDAYRLVLASTYRPEAIAYRASRGLTESDATMAVGCLRMVEPRVSGILFSRDFRNLDADRVELSVTRGLADKIVQGERNALQWILERGAPRSEMAGCLCADEPEQLFTAARRLEAHFGLPQDIEWALDRDGDLFILQTRQMAKARPAARLLTPPASQGQPVLAGGHTACPGAGSGPVFIILDPADLDRFPSGAVAVARHSSPAFSRIMAQAAAIVTEIGSPIGHMGILSREFGVPALVGVPNATRALKPGLVVTVDATSSRVFAGALDIERRPAEERAPPPRSPASESLRLLSRLITPLHLTEPAAPGFCPEGCKSLHDLTRFVHEKLYETMFGFSDRAARRLKNAYRVRVDLPLEIRLFDLGRGVAPGAGARGEVSPDEILSPLLRAILTGMCDPRINWKRPRPLSTQGFLSVVGESMLAPPAEAGNLDTVSFAVVSDLYLNFSIKAGYHFSTVDAYCDQSPHKNYISYRFAGGGADSERRLRRVRFLSEVLAQLDFEVQSKGDLLVGRLDESKPETVLDRLAELGRLALCSRQLDMLMDSEASPSFFTQAFLGREYDKF
jgi:pyruvate,water dikinase